MVMIVVIDDDLDATCKVDDVNARASISGAHVVDVGLHDNKQRQVFFHTLCTVRVPARSFVARLPVFRLPPSVLRLPLYVCLGRNAEWHYV